MNWITFLKKLVLGPLSSGVPEALPFNRLLEKKFGRYFFTKFTGILFSYQIWWKFVQTDVPLKVLFMVKSNETGKNVGYNIFFILSNFILRRDSAKAEPEGSPIVFCVCIYQITSYVVMFMFNLISKPFFGKG